ncbi:hypothetical protein E1091_02955 [Micromonospora fluostatini]|uniref:CobQ/CobB/MinD/ParA nucleotide binding domain-containing protein n=1 Tax=Micromonospora fluostatini TaxID=1629071 RepID=A0ABY2DLM1_9ACTN|nr:hypothetical protein E1091_02955 [Micromonospora fluostatini]
MPTNVSRPDWRCDICHTRMGDNQAAAERCESAGHPEVLPGGELLLTHERGWSERERGFRLRRLYPLPLTYAIGTLASTYNEKSGHYPYYHLDVDPVPHIGADGVLRGPQSNPTRIEGRHLHPHRPGHLNLTEVSCGYATRSEPKPGTRWPAEAVGLATGDALFGEPGFSGLMVKPLPPAVQAMLGALNAWVVPTTTDLSQMGGKWGWMERAALGTAALEACVTPQGKHHTGWARTWLHSHSHSEVLRQVNDRWRRWREGERISVPAPLIRCERQAHASKLTRTLKELVAEVGVEWPARTGSDDYVKLMLRETVGYEMETTSQLFAGPQVIVVTGTKGGVGKSSVAAALGRRLANEGRQVVIIDCDLGGPSQHILFAPGPARTDPQRGRVVPSTTDTPGLEVFSSGQVFAPGQMAWAEQTSAEWIRFVGSSVAVDDADVVILDMPPGDSAVHHQLLHSGEVAVTALVHVTTGHRLALADTERGLAASREARASRWADAAPKQVLIENMSRATGKGPDGTTVEVRLVGDSGAAEALAQRYQVPFGGSLPWYPLTTDLAASDEIGALAATITSD